MTQRAEVSLDRYRCSGGVVSRTLDCPRADVPGADGGSAEPSGSDGDHAAARTQTTVRRPATTTDPVRVSMSRRESSCGAYTPLAAITR